ncbi:MAG TPA: TMAO reductase system periplasmic protein TorT [Pusillimonas sp.]|uniref:TMAO reductase system periplasmic protein TorT n=1 Tax=Pusillimonas sp. TaxID=3040095 RepID=UPI002B8A8F9D|nr:TMAO reductase system periplasmic protein TorT [Pusillimonas sp.]HUH88342.1 TMAO reductase system periplasmic protein TorT [Pusillimonas sp.]
MKKMKTGIHVVAGVLLLAGSLSVQAAWSPLEVEAIAEDNARSPITYTALDKAAEPWNVCVSFPHMKDSFWLAADYGVTEEAKRQGINVQVLDAGGYTQLNNQISQIENCVAGGAKAVIIGAISQDGLGNLVADLKKKGVHVVDAYNGIASKDVDAHVLTIPSDEGLRAGRYLAAKHPAGSPAVKVAWLPGPAGAGWVELFNSGFLEGIKGSAVQIAETKYGDTGKEIQARLIEDLLQTHKDIDYVVGTAVTAEAAVPVLRARGITDKTKIVSVYTTPGVYQGVKSGAIEAAGMAPVVLVGRIAVDQAIRLIEGKNVHRNVGPVGRVYQKQDVDSLDIETVLAPDNFRPVFRVSAK